MKHLIRMSNVLLALALTAFSCSDDVEPKQDNKPYPAKKETLTVTAVQGSGNRPETRITYTPEETESGGAKLSTAWEESDEQIPSSDIPMISPNHSFVHSTLRVLPLTITKACNSQATSWQVPAIT